MLEFLTQNWPGILAALTALFVAADRIVKLTPSTADDDFVAKVENALSTLGVFKKDTPSA